jgi:hypothetical protein
MILPRALWTVPARFLAQVEQVEVGEDDGDHCLAREGSNHWREEMAGD